MKRPVQRSQESYMATPVRFELTHASTITTKNLQGSFVADEGATEGDDGKFKGIG